MFGGAVGSATAKTECEEYFQNRTSVRASDFSLWGSGRLHSPKMPTLYIISSSQPGYMALHPEDPPFWSTNYATVGPARVDSQLKYETMELGSWADFDDLR